MLCLSVLLFIAFVMFHGLSPKISNDDDDDNDDDDELEEMTNKCFFERTRCFSTYEQPPNLRYRAGERRCQTDRREISRQVGETRWRLGSRQKGRQRIAVMYTVTTQITVRTKVSS